MATITQNTLILKGFWADLITLGWKQKDVQSAIDIINSSTLLSDQLQDLSDKGWIIKYEATEPGFTSGNFGYTEQDVHNIITNEINGGSGVNGSFNKIDQLVGLLSYEVGHAEDPQGNSLDYYESDIQAGAEVAFEILGEGKSLVNNIRVEQELDGQIPISLPYTQVLKDINAQSWTQAVLDAAKSAASSEISGSTTNQSTLSYYWNLSYYNESYGQSAPSDISTALKALDINNATGATFVQNPDGTVKMTITFGASDFVTSYVVDFGSYGSIVEDETSGGLLHPKATPASPNAVTTYQEFEFQDGNYEFEIYMGNNGLFQLGNNGNVVSGQESGSGNSGGILDLSGVSTGLSPPKTITVSSVKPEVAAAQEVGAQEYGIDITVGQNTIYDWNFTTILGGNGLNTVDLPAAMNPSKGQTINFLCSDNGEVTTITGSDGWSFATEGITVFDLGNGDTEATGSGLCVGTSVGPSGGTPSGSSGGSSGSSGSPSSTSSSGATGVQVAQYGGTDAPQDGFTVAPSSSSADSSGGSDSGSGGSSGGSGSSGGAGGAGTFTLEAGNGNVIVDTQIENATVVFGSGNDTLSNAGAGSVIEAGSGVETFNLSNDVEIVGAEAQDVLQWAGQTLHGATEWASSQGDWAVNLYNWVEYGLDTLGDVIVKNVFGDTMTLTDYVGGPGAAYDTAGIYLAKLSMAAYKLLGPHPNVDFVMSQLSLANAEYKADTGMPLFPGMDPLVLDLTGNGLDLIGESDQSPLFDAYGDGFAVHTGWVKPDDGFLVWDNNGTYELFGAPGTSGFQALAAEDSNHDGVINAQDSIYANLYVWQDLNGNGVIDAGELTSLSALGITGINVASTPQTNDAVNGNYVTATGTFTYATGATGTIGDVNFLTDNFNTQYTGNTTVSAAAAALPNLKGYGTLDDLQVAMTNDPTGHLIATVQNVLPTLNVINLDSLRTAAMNILSAWVAAVPLNDTALAPGGHADVPVLFTNSGTQQTVTDYAYQVTGVNSTTNQPVTYWVLASGNPVLNANGNVIAYPTEAQVLAQTSTTGTWGTITGAELNFAERYLGDPITLDKNPSDSSQTLSVVGPELTAAWTAVNLETVRLAMQGPLAPYFAGLTYNTASDTFETGDTQLTPMFTAIFAASPTSAADATSWINSWYPILNIIEGNLAPAEDLTATYGYLFASMVAAYEATTMPLSITQVAEALGIPSSLIYDTGSTLQAASADANIIYAAGGTQTIIGSGGPDNDIFGSNFGNDVINNQNVNQDPDILWFATLDPSDITASRSGVDLILTDNKTGAQIDVQNEFIGMKPTLLGGNLNPVTGVQQIVFADGTVWNEPDIAYQAGLNTKGVDGTLLGTPGNDFLDGDNGNTFMEGYGGGDIYYYDRGDGNDTILREQGDILVTAPDIVEFGPGLTPADVTFTQDSEGDLKILVNGDPSDSLTVLGEFDPTFTGVFGTQNLNQIGGFQFSDGTEYSVAQIEQIIIADEEATPYNTIVGFAGNDVIDPGVGGNDYMTGGDGDDTYLFGLGYGNDTIYDGNTNILSPSNDTVLFNAGIDPSDVSVVRNGGSPDFTLVLSDGSTLTILDQFATIWAGPFGNIEFNQIDNFQFQDAANTDWTPRDIEDMAIAYQTSIPGGAIYGFWDGSAIDPGLNGNHLMVSGDAADTYLFGLGYGHDTIEDGSDGASTVLFNADVNPDDVKLIEGANDQDLTILLSDGSELDIIGQFALYATLDVSFPGEVGYFQFQNAAKTVWTNADIQATLLAQEQQIPDSTIAGFYGNNTLSGAAGNETLIGQNGTTTFLFGTGFGHELVELSDNRNFWTPRAVGTISFGPGILPSEIGFSSVASTGAELITINGDTADQLTIMNFAELLQPDWADSSLAGFEFSNGTFWSAAQIINILETDTLGSGLLVQGSTLTGPFPNNFVDPGINGNHEMVSTGGDVTYAFGLGYGRDTIEDTGYGGSEILFNADVNPATTQFIRGGTDFEDLTIVLADGSQLDIVNEFHPTPYDFGDSFENDVGTFQFQNSASTELTFSQIESILISAEESSPNSTIYSFYGGDTLSGASGNDTFVAVNGANTILFGRGDGVEVLSVFSNNYAYSSGADANIVFGSGITANSITLIPDGPTGNVNVPINGYSAALTVQITGTSDSLTILNATNALNGSQINFQFADGTTMTSAQIIASLETTALDKQLAIPGAPLDGPFPHNYVDPGLAGNHNMISDGGEDNTYVFGPGYGNDTIEDASSGGSTVLFNAGVNPSSIKLIRGGTGWFDLTVVLADGSTLDIANEFLPTAYGFGDTLVHDVGDFQFQDSSHTKWSFAQIESVVLASEELVPGGTIYSYYGGSTLSGAAGNNAFIAINGASTILFGRGDGNEYLSFENEGGNYAEPVNANVVFGQGISETQLQIFTDGGSGNITIRITGTSDSLTILGAIGMLNASGMTFQFSDGTVWNSSTISAMVSSSANSDLTWYGSASDSVLTGNDDAPNEFLLAPGGDSVTWGDGSFQNVVQFTSGDGAATINMNNGKGSIEFGPGITEEDLVFEGDSENHTLKIAVAGVNGSLTGDSIFISNYLEGGTFENVSFADGSTLSTLPITWTAATNPGSMVGSALALNTYDVSPGLTSIIFADGLGPFQNVVDYGEGDGTVNINVNGGQGDIVFGPGISAQDLVIEDNVAQSEITISFENETAASSGDTLLLQNAISSDISELIFAGGSTLSGSNLHTNIWVGTSTDTTLVGSDYTPNTFQLGAGGDSVTFGNASGGGADQNVVEFGYGDGTAIVNLNNAVGTIYLGASISANDVIFQSDGSGDLSIDLLDPSGRLTGDSLLLEDALYGYYGVATRIRTVVFANGSSIAVNGNLTDTWIGTANDPTLTGSGWSANLFELGSGGDHLTFGNGSDGGSNQNTVDFGYGDGAAIAKVNNGLGTIILGTSITSSDVIFQSDGAGDLTIALLNTSGQLTGDSLLLQGALYGYYGVGTRISNVTFSNGASIAINGNLTDTWIGTASNTTLTGSGWSANLFELGAGGDHLTFGNGADGGLYQNTVDFGYGDGAAVANVNNGTGTIDLGARITSSNVIFQSDSAGDLTIALLNSSGQVTGDSLSLQGALYGYYGVATRVGAVVFSNGTSIAINGNLTDTWIGTANSTNLTGSGWSANLFELGAGGDHVTFGNGVDGGLYFNTVDFGYGDGAAIVNVNNGTGTINLGASIVSSNVIFQSDAAGDLTIALLSASGQLTGDSLLLQGALYGDWGVASRIGNVMFASGTSIAINGNMTDTWIGTATNTTLTGSGWAANLFELGAGGDSVTFGNGNDGGLIQNTVDFSFGDGSAVINPNSVNGTIVLGAGITASNLSYQIDAAGDLIIIALGPNGTPTGDRLTILSNFTSSGYSYITQLKFADGTTLTPASVNVIAGTQTGQSASDESLVKPLSAVTIRDANPTAADSLSLTLTGTNGIASDADGTLSGGGLTKTGTGIYTLVASSPASLNAALDALIFTPTAHQVAPGGTVVTMIDLGISQNGLTSTNVATSIVVTASNDAPAIAGAKTGQATSDEATLKPLAAVTVTDPDLGVSDSVAITLSGANGLATDANGTLSGVGLTKTGSGLYTLAAASPASLTIELEALTFTPTAHQVAPGGTVVTVIDLAVTQNGLTSTNTLTSIVATAANDAPVITGATSGETTTDIASLAPFTGTAISDLDLGVTETATITLTGTAGTATDADGTLSGAGLTKIGTGTYTLAAATPASLTAELDSLSFTPTPRQVAVGNTLATHFTLSVSQNGLATVNTLTSVLATAVSNPLILGALAAQATTDETTLKPFSAVQINNASTIAAESLTITLSGTGGTATDADGTLSGTGLSKIGMGVYSLTAGAPASLVSELEALTFTPTSHQVAPGGTVVTGFTLVATQSGASATNAVTSVVVTAVNDAPTITGAKANQATTDEAALKPLSAVIATDPDLGASDSVVITLSNSAGAASDADGTLSGAGLTKTGTGLYTLTANTPANLTSELDALVFTPTGHQVAPGSTVLTTIDLAVTQNGTSSTNTTTSVIATALNDAPVITGVQAGQTTNDETTLRLFSATSITDLDFGVSDSVTITLTNGAGTLTDADGTLSGSGVTKTSAGLYTLSAATPASLTAELDAIIFTPAAHQAAPGGTVVTDVRLAVTQNSLTTTNSVTNIITTAINDPPIIAGVKSGQATTDEAPIRPFFSVSISDPDLGATDSANLTVTGAGGTATDADGTLSGTGLSKTGTGTYTLTAMSPASLTTELDALTFTPTAHQVTPGATVTTMIDMAITQNGATTTNSLTSISAAASNDPPVITGTKAGQAASDETVLHPFSGTTITDVDLGIAETVTITLTGTAGTATDANGLLSGNGLSKTGVGIYTLAAATPASLTSELAALTFTPTAHQVAPGNSVTTGMLLAVTQNNVTTTNSVTNVIATAVNDPPIITGAVSGQTSVDYVTIKPFSSVIISDVDTVVSDSVTITLESSIGVATDADGTLSGTGLSKGGTGSYTLSATSVAGLTLELESLVFTPTQHQVSAGSTVVTDFNLAAHQIAGGTTVTAANTAASLIVTALNYITGPSTGKTTINGSTGSDVITASGTLNTINSNGGNDFIIAGSGQATVNAGAGNNVIVLGGSLNSVTGTNGNDTISGASGGLTHVTLGNGNDTVSLGGSGDTITVGTGTDLISGVQGTFHLSTGSGADTFDFAAASLTAAGTISAGAGNDVISFTTAGTISSTAFTNVTGVDAISLFSGTNSLAVSDAMVASSDSQILTIFAAAGNEVINAASVKAGHDVVFSVGTGNSTLTGGAGNDTFIAGAGSNVFIGDGGADTYEFARGDGTLSINNTIAGGKSASGQLDFGPGINEQDLWFIESGTNLVIDRIDSTDQITIQSWFGTNSSAGLAEIKGSDNLEIDTGLAQLISAMAAFSSSNSNFNPMTATQMPSNTVLQSAIAAAWHS